MAAGRFNDYRIARAPATQTAIAAALAWAGEIDRWVADIQAFDLRATDLGQRSQDVQSGGAGVRAIDALIKKAADALAQANPIDPAVVAQAEALLKLPGGQKKLDALVRSLGSEADDALICQLAEKRFGIQMGDRRVQQTQRDGTTVTLASHSDQGKATITAQGTWEALAQVPGGHAKQPSLKKVSLEKPNSGGGAFNWVDKKVIMNGRPDDGRTEKFDADTRMEALGHNHQDD